MSKRNNYDLSKLTVDTRYSSLPPDKVVEGVGYSQEIYAMNKGVLQATVERHPVYGVPYEWEEQTELIRWKQKHENEYPGLDMLIHIPNGEYREDATAAKLKGMGTSPGFPDLELLVARGGFHGWLGEMKRTVGSKMGENQPRWIDRLIEEGFFCTVLYGFEEAKDSLIWYLSQPRTIPVDEYFLNR